MRGLPPGLDPASLLVERQGEFVIGANQDGIFRRLAQAMGRPELATDERYAGHAARGKHQTELDGLIDAWTRTKTLAELEAITTEAGVPAGRIFRAQDMLQDPHFAAREALVEVEHPRWGKLAMQNACPKLSETPSSVRTLAPSSVGQDNGEVYGALGLGADEIEDLRTRGVI